MGSAKASDDFAQLDFRLFGELGIHCEIEADDPGEIRVEGVKPIFIQFEEIEDPEGQGNRRIRISASTTRRANGKKLSAFKETLSTDEARSDAPEHFLNSSPMVRLPSHQMDFLRSVEEDLTKAITQVGAAVRWRRNVFGTHKAVSRFGHMEFRLSGTKWVHGNLQIPGYAIGIQYGSISPISDVSVLLNEQVFELPLAYELYMESIELLRNNPRSTLTLLVAAIESGLKNCIRRLAPETSWLLQNLPSPPVVSLLTGYLPTLLSKDHQDTLQSVVRTEAIETLKAATQQRNELVHGARRTVNYQVVEKCAALGHDLIWMFEFLGGTAWAKEYIGHSPRKWARFEQTSPNTWQTGYH